MRALAAVFLCAFAAPCSAQEEDPVPGLVKALGSKKVTDELRAERRLLKLGGQAVPALLKGLQKEKPGSDHANRILRTLGRLRRDAVSALPRLLQLLRTQDESAERVLEAINQIAPYDPDQNEEIVSALGEAWMKRTRGGGRIRGRKLPSQAVVRSKNRLEVHCNMSTKKLLELLNDGNSVQREAAAELLVDADGDKQNKIEALRSCLDRPKRRESMRARFQTANMSASISTSLDNYRNEQLAVAAAIVKLSATKDVPAQAWVILLGHEDASTVRRAVHGVTTNPNPEAVRGLLALTKHRNPTLGWEAITVLGMMGKVARQAIPRLEKLSEDANDKATAARAKAALASIRRDIAKKQER